MKTFGPRNQASEQMKLKLNSAFSISASKGNRHSRPKIALTAGLLAVALGGAMWFANQAGWTPPLLAAILFPAHRNEEVFSPQAGLDQNQARELYRKSLQALKEKNYQQALEGFTKLEKAYPGLRDLILLHQAEAYAGLPDEKHAQERLRLLLVQEAQSPLKAVASYQLAQSLYRTGRKDDAFKLFEEIRQKYPESPYATGSLYYLGNLLNERAESHPDNRALAIADWKEYLDKSPDGRFSFEITRVLEGALKAPTADDYRLMGLGYAHDGQDWNKAVQYLSKAPFQAVWLELGRSQLKGGKAAAGLQSLSDGLPYAKDSDEAKKAVDMIVRNSSSSQQAIQRLEKIAQGHPKTVGGDYLLWRLAELDSSKAPSYLQTLLKNYPQGDYSPESSWKLLWPLISQQQFNEFLNRGETHLKRYPYSKSAAKVMFWQGKILEFAGEKDLALSKYQATLKRYPNSYYAFRANGRLEALKHHQADPGWKTVQAAAPYPPSQEALSVSPLEASPEVKAGLMQEALELQEIQAPEDLALLLEEALGDVPPPVKSWNAFAQGDKPGGIRTIRDYLDEKAKKGQQPTKEELKLLYPVYFSEFIAREAPKNQLDPYLVQSLMREESYFNELAVSGSNARGLMQLLPSTAKEVAQQRLHGSFQLLDLFSPESNIRLGTNYLGYLHRTFQENSMLAVGAYNGGPNAMKRWVNGSSALAKDPDFFVESIPYDQTRDYIKKVYASYWNYNRLYNPDHRFR